MEVITGYLRAYLLRSHTQFWEVAQDLVDWMATNVGTDVRRLHGDCDVLWSSGGDPSSPTAQCRDFCVHNQCEFVRSPPYTQNLNPVEGRRMKALLQSMYAMMNEAKMGQSAWGYSLIHAAYLLNISPRPGADMQDMPDSRGEREPDPRMAFTPQGGLQHVMPDISTVPVPLWSIGYIRREGAKPSQLEPCSDVGLFCGVAEGTIGFKLLRLSDLVCVSSYHVQFDQDLRNRPAVMTQHKGRVGRRLCARRFTHTSHRVPGLRLHACVSGVRPAHG